LGRKDLEWLSDGDAIKRKAGHLADANIEVSFWSVAELTADMERPVVW
jgi:hypothetical protein